MAQINRPQADRRALIVIDVQNGFINAETAHIPAGIADLLGQAAFERCIFTRFLNIAGSPFETALNWHAMHGGNETQIVAALLPYAGDVRIKHTYTALDGALVAELAAARIDQLVLVGLETDACILKTAYDAFEANFRLCILSDLCASMAGSAVHEGALALMRRNLGQQSVCTRQTFLGQ